MARRTKQQRKEDLQTEECCVCKVHGIVGKSVIPVRLKDLFGKRSTPVWVHHGECHQFLVVQEGEEATVCGVDQ